MLAAYALELPRGRSGGGGALDVSHVLLEPTLGEMPSTVRALCVPRTLSWCHFYIQGPAISPSREGIEAARAFVGNGSRKRSAFQRMSAAASRFYRADLGQLDESAERIFQAWADSQKHRHVLVKEDDGKIALYAEREAERQKKSHMAALRTTISNWKIPVQCPAGFLRLLSEAEFRAALASLPSQPPIAEPTGIESPTSAPQLLPASYSMTLPSLGSGFDDRARALLAALVAARRPDAATHTHSSALSSASPPISGNAL